METSYRSLIEQSFDFPQNGFSLDGNDLCFNDISIKDLIKKYGTPFRLFYLPKIGDQISKARLIFNNAISKYDYKGQYQYCYCTKSNHFSHVVRETLKHDVHLETSSAFDIDLIWNFHKNGRINKDTHIINNGLKTDAYLQKILQLYRSGFKNSIIVLDSTDELKRLLKLANGDKIKIGIRMAINEEAQFSYHTSRLGIRENEILDFYQNQIKHQSSVELKMIHFFVDSGIKDSIYFWGEFKRALNIYCQLKKHCKELNAFNLGGGFPIQNNLRFKFDYVQIADEIVSRIQNACYIDKIPEPDIYTEFGKYTVGECSATIFEVLQEKQQNDAEKWYIINNSLINTIPDAWSIHEKFILLPINKWDNEYSRTNIGGMSCDHADYYNSEDMNQEIILPNIDKEDTTPLYLGFFHTGAYQDAISGYGGIKHCLIPSPKHVVIDRDNEGKLCDYLYRDEQNASEMIRILGYND